MIVGQTVFSVRKGTEHERRPRCTISTASCGRGSHQAHRVMRSFGMSPIASALHDETLRASSARSTTWSRASGVARSPRRVLSQRSGRARLRAAGVDPHDRSYEVLYDVLEQADRSGVAAYGHTPGALHIPVHAIGRRGPAET